VQGQQLKRPWEDGDQVGEKVIVKTGAATSYGKKAEKNKNHNERCSGGVTTIRRGCSLNIRVDRFHRKKGRKGLKNSGGNDEIWGGEKEI